MDFGVQELVLQRKRDRDYRMSSYSHQDADSRISELKPFLMPFLLPPWTFLGLVYRESWVQILENPMVVGFALTTTPRTWVMDSNHSATAVPIQGSICLMYPPSRLYRIQLNEFQVSCNITGGKGHSSILIRMNFLKSSESCTFE